MPFLEQGSRVVLEYEGGKTWQMGSELLYRDDSTARIYHVPSRWADTTTDMASIPKSLWHLLPPFGAYLRAALVHDDLCDVAKNDKAAPPDRGLPGRKNGDDLLLRVCEEDGVPRSTRVTMWTAVRFFGWWGHGKPIFVAALLGVLPPLALLCLVVNLLLPGGVPVESLLVALGVWAAAVFVASLWRPTRDWARVVFVAGVVGFVYGTSMLVTAVLRLVRWVSEAPLRRQAEPATVRRFDALERAGERESLCVGDYGVFHRGEEDYAFVRADLTDEEAALLIADPATVVVEDLCGCFWEGPYAEVIEPTRSALRGLVPVVTDGVRRIGNLLEFRSAEGRALVLLSGERVWAVPADGLRAGVPEGATR